VAEDFEALIRAALAEDRGARDITTEATVPADARARAVFLAKQDLVVSGLDAAVTTFRLLDPAAEWTSRTGEGRRVAFGEVMGELQGAARAILGAERVALNFLQRLSGVATLTRRFVDEVAGTRARIRDTRKTTPLLRALEKRAVVAGGGVPHRQRLDDGILVKDNHVRLAGSVAEATRRAVAGSCELLVEVEVERLDQIEEALGAGAEMILLDNFTPDEVGEAVARIAGRVPVEVSGGVRLENVRAYAEAGPHYIAVGALTHSAPAVDISLELDGDG
jgi:nicotinate-nucleotide pyrophosphorylase (carboxylating)